jgi:hypothetical protein
MLRCLKFQKYKAKPFSRIAPMIFFSENQISISPKNIHREMLVLPHFSVWAAGSAPGSGRSWN